MVDRIYSLLLLLFINVLYLFIKDFLNLKEVLNLLYRWAEQSQESIISQLYIIIVTTQTVNSIDFIKSLLDILKSFSSITIIALLNTVEVLLTTRYFLLKNTLL